VDKDFEFEVAKIHQCTDGYESRSRKRTQVKSQFQVHKRAGDTGDRAENLIRRYYPPQVKVHGLLCMYDHRSSETRKVPCELRR
jgi:hypothetical protein